MEGQGLYKNRPLLAKVIQSLLQLCCLGVECLVRFSNGIRVLTKYQEDWPVDKCMIVPVSYFPGVWESSR
jgi:hypothetical protein